MNKRIYQALSFTAFLFLVFSTVSNAQVTSSTSSSVTDTPEVYAAKNAANKVLLDAGASFKEGLLAYSANNRSAAGERFNKSVEVFLYSTLNIQKDAKLQS